MRISRHIKTLVLAALVAVALAVALLLYVQRAAAPFIYKTAEDAPASAAALVLGASVYQNGALSPVLEARAERALELYRLRKVKKILVTGDNSEITHNEVNPVGNYLVGHGVPKSDIFLDHAGFDTYSSMYRARDVFGVSDMLIVSQPFHLARAVYIARALGLNARAVEAAGQPSAFNTLREAPATLKALLDLVINRSPKYLGTTYPIGGDGSATWADATTTGQIH